MVKYILTCIVSILLISAPAFSQEASNGYLEGGPSENFEAPSLDLQRSYYGTFEKTKDVKAIQPRTREAAPLAEPVIMEVPTFAEVEAAKAKTTAEAAMEVSKKAEATAVQAKQESAEAKAASEQSIAAANQAIQTANQAIDKTNQTIDKVNAINENLAQENAKLRFEMEQKAQALEQKDQELSDDIAKLKQEIEGTTAKEAAATFSFYTVKPGDFLIKIAGKKDIYGTGEEWEKIYRANRDKIQNPNLIYPGQELQIPRSTGVKVKKAARKVKKTVKASVATDTKKQAPKTSKPAASKTPTPAQTKAAPGKPVVKVPAQPTVAGKRLPVPGPSKK